MGILHMTNAVSFLNNDCKLVSAAGRGTNAAYRLGATEQLLDMLGVCLLAAAADPWEHLFEQCGCD